MENLIVNSSIRTLVNGKYTTDKYVYEVEYTYDNKILATISIVIKTPDGKYVGSSSYRNGTLNTVVSDPITLREHTDIITSLYSEIQTIVKNS